MKCAICGMKAHYSAPGKLLAISGKKKYTILFTEMWTIERIERWLPDVLKELEPTDDKA